MPKGLSYSIQRDYRKAPFLFLAVYVKRKKKKKGKTRYTYFSFLFLFIFMLLFHQPNLDNRVAFSNNYIHIYLCICMYIYEVNGQGEVKWYREAKKKRENKVVNTYGADLQ